MKAFLLLILTITSPIIAQDRDDRNRHHHEKSKTPFFRFSFGSRKMMHEKTFDVQNIFGLDVFDVENLIYESKRQFRQESDTLKEEIRYYEKNLALLIETHKNGLDKSQELQETLTKLHTLTRQLFQLSQAHAKEVFQQIEQMYTTSDAFVLKQLQDTNTIIPTVIERYDNFIKNN